ncbi:threonine dehydratase [Dongia deserti]|uniref:threonine dehydratase n=1 Tax=Dongia deserti TaxID=2268030 RepID=UPI000E65CCBC|nr:threonine dehydratase [Dongia deserti]
MSSTQQIEAAAALVHGAIGSSPQICWPLLSERVGAETWVKHENHLPTGAFKVRGGLTYIARLRQEQPAIRGVIAATRGNHGQSIAFAARQFGLPCVITVPYGNSRSKNAAMRAYGAELIETGHDFQATYEATHAIAEERKLHFVRSFHPWLLEGVATYGWELMRAVPDLATIYVPIGLGSGICSTIQARDALGLKTEIVGVVAEDAAAYSLSFEARKAISTNSADTIADGVACRVPVEDALEIVWRGASRVICVTEGEIKSAMRAYFADTHNVAEGAGATPLAAALKDTARKAGKVGLILTGGNVDTDVYARVLSGA